MDIYFRGESKWSRSDSLLDALGLGGKGKQVPGPCVIALTGAGGKTSLMRRLAWEGKMQGARVLVTTTTHIARPSRLGVFTGQAEDVRAMLEEQSVAVTGFLTDQGKIRAVEAGLYKAICPMADLVLVEADGSRRLPLKAPRPGEPVIPENADMILCVSGLSALGRPGEERCCRLEQAMAIMEEHGRGDYMDGGQWRIAPGDMGCLMRYGYLEPMREQHGNKQVIPVFNQADAPSLIEVAEKIVEELHEDCGLVTGRLHEDESAFLF